MNRDLRPAVLALDQSVVDALNGGTVAAFRRATDRDDFIGLCEFKERLAPLGCWNISLACGGPNWIAFVVGGKYFEGDTLLGVVGRAISYVEEVKRRNESGT